MVLLSRSFYLFCSWFWSKWWCRIFNRVSLFWFLKMVSESTIYNSSAKKSLIYLSVFQNTVKEYMSNTTIHGLNYIQRKSSFLVTRFVWTTLVAASLSAFTYYSFSIYTRWLEEPIVMNLDDKLAEIQEIPFPAVSIAAIFRVWWYGNLYLTTCPKCE